MTEISQQEFDDIWNTHLIDHQVEWNKTKRKYTTGVEVTGYIQIFCLQGVLVNFGENRLGVANYAECSASAKPEWMYPGFKVTAIVADCDELNDGGDCRFAACGIFGLYLRPSENLPLSRVHARPAASNANRWTSPYHLPTC